MELFDSLPRLPIEKIQLPGISSGPELWMKRFDLIHPIYGGNKFYKLKYHLKQFYQANNGYIASSGGPFSNHLYALAGIGRELKIPSIGIVRGFPHYIENPLLQSCLEMGMQIAFIKPNDFNPKSVENVIHQQFDLKNEDYYLIPLGGTDDLGIKGAMEMLEEDDLQYDFIACGLGTGGTSIGLIRKSSGKSKILSFSSIKNPESLKELINDKSENYTRNYEVIDDYHFGGFAKKNAQLDEFVEDFIALNQIKIEPIYQAKMLFGLRDLIKKEYFSRAERILTLHTGGLIGAEGYDYLSTKLG